MQASLLRSRSTSGASQHTEDSKASGSTRSVKFGTLLKRMSKSTQLHSMDSENSVPDENKPSCQGEKPSSVFSKNPFRLKRKKTSTTTIITTTSDERNQDSNDDDNVEVNSTEIACVHEAQTTKTGFVFTPTLRDLDGSFLENGAAEKEAMIEALTSQLEQATRDLEQLERDKRQLMDSHAQELLLQETVKNEAFATLQAQLLQEQLMAKEVKTRSETLIDWHAQEVATKELATAALIQQWTLVTEGLEDQLAKVKCENAELKGQLVENNEMMLRQDHLQQVLRTVYTLFADHQISLKEFEDIVLCSVKASFGVETTSH